MTSRGLTILTVAWVLVVAGGCSSGKSSKGVGHDGSAGGTTGSSSSSSGAGGSTGFAKDAGAMDAGWLTSHDAGVSADAGPSADGAPFIADTGRDGSGGKGGSTGGTGGKLDAGPAGPCRIDISAADSVLGLNDLIPGDDRTLKVKGNIVWGTTPRVTPTWEWTVKGPDNTTLTTTDLLSTERDTAIVQFPLLASGDYEITVSVTPTCRSRTQARAGKEWPQKYFVRVLPPPSGIPNSGQTCQGSNRWCPSEDAVPFEQVIKLEQGRPFNMGYLSLQNGSRVTIDPMSVDDPEAAPSIAIPSSIHIAPHLSAVSPYSTWTIDGASTVQKGLQVVLNSNLQYDVLVVPSASQDADRMGFPGLRLPPFRTTLRVEDFQQTKFAATPGIEVKGTVRVAGGPLMGARVLLRAAAVDQLNIPLPSTWGVSDAMGVYSLRARGDTSSPFSVIVIPPTGTTLPQVTFPTCIDLRAANDGDTLANVDFTWNALNATNLTVTVMADEQSPAASVLVRLQSNDEGIPDSGILSINGMVADSPDSNLRLEATTDKSGVVSFDTIPKAGYHLVLLPPEDMANAAITTAEIDLTGASHDEQRIFQLSRKVKLTGTISPKASANGGRIVAIDTGTDVLENTLSSVLDGEGNYTLLAAPGRTYRFSVEPTPGKGLPSRIPLYGVTATTQNLNQINRKLPTGLKVNGTVWFVDHAVPGAIVQVYCQQSGMSGCMDPQNPTPNLPMPVAETSTQTDGSYTVYLPDPGSGH